ASRRAGAARPGTRPWRQRSPGLAAHRSGTRPSPPPPGLSPRPTSRGSQHLRLAQQLSNSNVFQLKRLDQNLFELAHAAALAAATLAARSPARPHRRQAAGHGANCPGAWAPLRGTRTMSCRPASRIVSLLDSQTFRLNHRGTTVSGLARPGPTPPVNGL